MTRKSSTRERLLAGLLAVTLLLSSFLTAQAKTPVTRPAVDVPDLVSPPNNGHVTGNPDDSRISTDWLVSEPLGIPTFEWEDVGASKYRLQVATGPGFGSDVILDLEDIEYTTYTPTGFERDLDDPGFGLTDDGQGNFEDQATFYWRVSAWDDDTSTWGAWQSSPASFTRHWGYKPILNWPEDGSTHDKIPYFKWQAVPGTSFYQIQIDTNDGFGTPLVDETTDIPVFAPTGIDFGEQLANDDDLFWRVRAFHRPNQRHRPGDGRGGEWSEARWFKLAWSSITTNYDTRPLPLTPPNNANYINRPLFCWQPVAGAEKYRIYVSQNTNPALASIVNGDRSDGQTEGTCYVFPKDKTYDLETGINYYWMVVAEDGARNLGESTYESGGVFRFTSAPSETAQVPTLFYPPYYYEPIMSDTFEDRTVAQPTFVWDHVEGATSYELRIDDDVAMADPPTAIVETANASFTFTDTASYPLEDGEIYYWKVRANGAPNWSTLLNKWKVRVDRQKALVTGTIQLIQPTYQVEKWAGDLKYGQESVTYYPTLSWTAIAPLGGTTYEVKIARDPEMNQVVHTGQTNFTEYTPVERPEPATYFWQVCTTGATGGDCSEVGRFIVSRNFTYHAGISVDGDPTDWEAAAVPIYTTTNEIGDVTSAPAIYDLSGFYVAANDSNWYLGVPLSPTVELGIYLDTNHYDSGGAIGPPSGKSGPDVPVAHQPEFAIYWSDTITEGQVYQWSKGSGTWTFLGSLFSIGSEAAYDDATKFLEIQLNAGAIGHPGSLALMMFSVDGTGQVQDRLPNLPQDTTRAAFLTESTTPTPLFPANAPNNAALATIEHNTPVLTWRHNQLERSAGAPFYFRTYQDDTFSTLYEDEQGHSPESAKPFWNAFTHWAPQVHYSDNESYVWRVERVGYAQATPHQFIKRGYIPTDLEFSPLIVSGTITYTNRTPSFQWQPVQSAPTYVWRLFESGDPVLEEETMVPYYTPRKALPDGTYTWKVWAKDAQDRESAEAAQGAFNKVYDTLQIKEVEFGAQTLVLRWDPIDYAAYYEILIADDPNFTDPEVLKTYNTTLTPAEIPEQVKDNVFYVRVFIRDNQDNQGPDREVKFGYKTYLPLTVKGR